MSHTSSIIPLFLMHISASNVGYLQRSGLKKPPPHAEEALDSTTTSFMGGASVVSDCSAVAIGDVDNWRTRSLVRHHIHCSFRINALSLV